VLRVLFGTECLSADLDAGIERIVMAHHQAGNFSGSALVARGGRVVYRKGFGYANLEWKIPNAPQIKFEIGSMTKQFTALLILQFVHERRLQLDDRLSEDLPYYRKDTGSRITIHDLLTHTSGIPNFIDAPGFLEGPDSRRAYTIREFVASHCSGDLAFESGTRFAYGNSGYFLLGAILEQISGKSYERLLRERIFEPLGMKDSGYARNDVIVANRASGYERSQDGPRNARFYDMSIPFAAHCTPLWTTSSSGTRLFTRNA
jgi:CubicO group peptidase (beta-lactamase class C family)